MGIFKSWISKKYKSTQKKKQQSSRPSVERPVQIDHGNVIYLEQYRRLHRKREASMRSGKL